MKPVHIAEANVTLQGDPAHGVSDLKVLLRQYSGGVQTVTSEWKLSVWERIVVMFTGSVFCSVATRDYPPIKLSIENKA